MNPPLSSFLMLFILFYLLQASTTIPVQPTVCPATPSCECRQIQSRTFVICSQLRDLAEVAKSVPPSTLSSTSSLPFVRLVDSSISVLGPKAFGDLRAQSLQINASNLSVISDDAFVGMQELRALALQDNELLSIPAQSLARTPNLELFSLAGNHIDRIQTDDLQHLRQLKYLSLAENNIESIEPGALPSSLIQLALNSNKLKEIGDAFKPTPTSREGFPYLELLLLSNNSLREIHDELSQLFFLQILLLSYNQLENVTGAFDGLGHIRILHLKHNRLTNIDGIFDDLVNLEELAVRNNFISRIDKLGFHPALASLDLSSNQIVHINGNSFHQSLELTKLNLSDNNLGRIPVHALSPLKHLVTFDISRNQIKTLDGLEHLYLPALKNLVVAGNELTSLPPNFSKHVPSLMQLDLSYNLLTIFPADGFRGLNLRLLRIQGNRLKCDLKTSEGLNSTQVRLIEGKPLCLNTVLPTSTEIQ